jgi:hypothetical protein
VSLIKIYELGFDKIDELDEEVQEAFYKVRENEINYMMEIQFILSYLGNISKQDSDEMTIFELHNWFNLLKKQKAIEAEKAKEK